VDESDRRLVVDAMNVIGSRPTGWWRDRDQAVRDLAARLHRYVQGSGTDVTLVVDGHPIDQLPKSEAGRMRVRYAHSRSRDAADDAIVSMLEASDDACVVVTADRDLRDRAVERGASVVGPRELLRRLDEVEEA
jgi:predicted RNA-binding protein with PIN domain